LRAVLVTGAAGYVGSGLVADLQASGWDVRAAVREPAVHLPAEQAVGDIAHEAGAAERAVEGMDAVVHLAGDNEVVAARDPAFALNSTILASQRLAAAAAAGGVKRFVYMSTMHVYGRRVREGAVLSEDMRPEPHAPYAIARLASEYLVSGHGGDMEVVSLRLTNSLGAPAHPLVNRWTLVSNDLCRQGVRDGRLELRSTGLQWRDFVALSDVRSTVLAALESGGPLPPGTYNLGSGKSMTIRDLASLVQDAVERCTGTRPPLEAPEPEGPGPGAYSVSIARLAEQGLEASTPIADAVEETVRFCIDHQEELLT